MPAEPDPFEHLVITRRRKRYKFAHFNAYPNCFEYLPGTAPQAVYQDITSYLPHSDRKKPGLVIELAAGNAQFSLELARRNSQTNFMATDIKSDRLYTSARQALAEGVANIAFVRMPIGSIAALVPGQSVDEMWLTFPDPHPKKRSAKHRLTHPAFLQQYRTILKKTGSLKFKTDNRELFLWSLEQFVAEKWRIAELSFDLHESNLSEDYKIKTHYEQRFVAQGLPINYCALIQG